MPNFNYTPNWYYLEGRCINDVDDCYVGSDDIFYDLETENEVLDAIATYNKRLAELRQDEQEGDPDAWYYIDAVKKDLKKLNRRLQSFRE